MKAWVLKDIQNLQMEIREEPVPSEGEVLMAVKAAGICGSDIPRIYETGTYSYPLIPGHEFAGYVMRLGKGVDEQWLHQRAGVFPLIPCKKCMPCQRKQYEMCRSYDYLGSRRDGAFAEQVLVPADNLIRLPDCVSYEEAAMMEPMTVAAHAIRRIKPLKDEAVAVCGLGTIGMSVLMFLIESGVSNILAIGKKELQKKTALRIGIPEECYCDIRERDARRWLMEKTDGEGAAVFFECVGRNETLDFALENTMPGGRIVLIGNPGSDMILKKNVYWKILRNQYHVTGTWNSSFTHEAEDDWHYVLERLEKGRVAPSALISHRFPLEELRAGLEIMRDKSEDYLKVMGIVG